MAYKKRLLLILFFGAIITGSLLGLSRQANTPSAPIQNPQQKVIEQPTAAINKATNPAQPTGFNKSQYSIEDPASLWVIVNKKRALPSTYSPQDLYGQIRKPAADALLALTKDARSDGVNLITISGFRSYATQQSLYQSYVAKDGQAAADTYSARAGHSEHQTGLAVDLGNADGSCALDACFGTTQGGTWLSKNAYKYGFIIRYPQQKVTVTGYQYEPWHLRYVGKDLATELQTKQQTMEEFFGVGAASDY